EAEQKARIAEQERLLQHEQEVKRIEATRRKGVHPAVFAVVGVLVVAGGIGGYLVYDQQRTAAAEAARVAQVAAERESAQRQEAERLAQEAQAAADAARRQIAEMESQAAALEARGDTAAAEQVRAQ